MKILIIEDEKLAAEKLITLLTTVATDCEVISTQDSIDGAVAWLTEHPHPDLIISDIHLIDGLCFNIFSQVEVTCPIIFATAYEKYAIQAFEVNSIDYLLKPVQEDRLRQALNKYSALNQSQVTDRSDLYDEFKKLLSNKNKNYKSRFLCKLGNKIKSIPTENIAYFYSANKMTFLVDNNQQRLPVNNTLDEIDQLIDPDSFFRVNRKFISHYGAIAEIHPYFKGRLKLKLSPHIEEDIVVSTEKSPIFKAWLDR
jgi:DNA-binding LytR/AlgR family response regulator